MLAWEYASADLKCCVWKNGAFTEDQPLSFDEQDHLVLRHLPDLLRHHQIAFANLLYPRAARGAGFRLVADRALSERGMRTRLWPGRWRQGRADRHIAEQRMPGGFAVDLRTRHARLCRGKEGTRNH